MEAARPPLHLVDTATGEVQATCEHCLTKDQAIERLTKSYEGTIRNLRDELAAFKDDREATWPDDEAADMVMRRWLELAMASRWFTREPMCEPTSTRWRDTKRALRGTKNKTTGEWDWPPRSAADLLLAATGAFVRGEEQRNDSRFKRDYLDPCTAFFSNYSKNWEAATDPAPKVQTRARSALLLPKRLLDRWPEVEALADVCDRCAHIRLDHRKPSLVGDGLNHGPCDVHGCVCDGYDDFWFQSERWMDKHARGNMQTSSGPAARERPGPDHREDRSL